MRKTIVAVALASAAALLGGCAGGFSGGSTLPATSGTSLKFSGHRGRPAASQVHPQDIVGGPPHRMHFQDIVGGPPHRVHRLDVLGGPPRVRQY